jgi:hypothetical protein
MHQRCIGPPLMQPIHKTRVTQPQVTRALFEREKGFEGGDASGSPPIVEGRLAESLALGASAIDRQGPSAETAVTSSQDPVVRDLSAALGDWGRAHDRKSLRRALLDLLRDLENDDA